jgi:ribosomal protein S18 acetylase RimI-like enzyme
MQIRSIRAEEIERVRVFLCANGWAHRLGSAGQFAQLVAHSQRTAVASDGAAILGFARGITDDVSNGYLSMVVVSPEHRRTGIGRALVAHIVGEGDGITWVLRAGREGASEFFGKLGFAASVVAMERVGV